MSSPPLRILALSHVVLQHGIRGGMEKYFDLVVHGLARLGHDVIVVTTEMVSRPTARDLVPLHPLPVPSGARGKDWSREVRAFVKNQSVPPEVILGNSSAAFPLTGCGVPIVSILQGHDFVDLITSLRLASIGHASPVAPLREAGRVVKSFLENPCRIINSFAQVIAVSEQTKKSIARIYSVPLDKIKVIPAPVDTNLFYPRVENIREALSAQEPFKVITAGTLTRQKGFEFVLQALSILNRGKPAGYHLTVAGDGPEMRRLQFKARQLEIAASVHFARSLPDAALSDALRRSDLFVLATLREEGFPLVIAEAMASGLPVVATRVGGNPSAVREGVDGYLVETGSALSLANAITRLADDPDLYRRMARNARERAVTELDSRLISRKLEDVLWQAIVTGITHQ